MKDLTTSAIDRQNILNNPEALNDIQQQLGITGMLYENEYRFTTAQVADYFEVSTKTIKRHLETNKEELETNGYTVLKGQNLKTFKKQFGHLIYQDVLNDESQRYTDDPLWPQILTNKLLIIESDSEKLHKKAINRVKALALFNFRALLNIGMLLTESENAIKMRSKILDIVIESLHKQFGVEKTFVNQRDGEFLVAISREPKYRKEYTSALSRYVDMGPNKYSYFTDEIYKAIFNENAAEYRKILNLKSSVNPRDTMYAEVLKLITSFELGITDEMTDRYKRTGRRLKPDELKQIIADFAAKRHWIPQLEDARKKMASRDYGLRNVMHEKLNPYLSSLSQADYQRFLGDNEMDLLNKVIDNPELIEVLRKMRDNRHKQLKAA